MRPDAQKRQRGRPLTGFGGEGADPEDTGLGGERAGLVPERAGQCTGPAGLGGEGAGAAQAAGTAGTALSAPTRPPDLRAARARRARRLLAGQHASSERHGDAARESESFRARAGGQVAPLSVAAGGEAAGGELRRARCMRRPNARRCAHCFSRLSEGTNTPSDARPR